MPRNLDKKTRDIKLITATIGKYPGITYRALSGVTGIGEKSVRYKLSYWPELESTIDKKHDKPNIGAKTRCYLKGASEDVD